MTGLPNWELECSFWMEVFFHYVHLVFCGALGGGARVTNVIPSVPSFLELGQLLSTLS